MFISGHVYSLRSSNFHVKSQEPYIVRQSLFCVILDELHIIWLASQKVAMKILISLN